jgi:hypothetical protein
LRPGYWCWNKYNWHAVVGFLRHMPWDCQSVAVSEEDGADDDLRIFAFVKPDGRLVVVVSNRSFAPHKFKIETSRPGRTFTGVRYTPESAGENFAGVPIGKADGSVISPVVPDMAWEFWEEV